MIIGKKKKQKTDLQVTLSQQTVLPREISATQLGLGRKADMQEPGSTGKEFRSGLLLRN